MKTKLFMKLMMGGAALFIAASSYSQNCSPWSGTGLWKGKGRIAISSDGNEHDKDDWAATPFSLALLAAKGLQNQLALYTYSDHIWGSNHDQSNARAQMNSVISEGKVQFGFTTTNFIEAVANPTAAYNALAAEINKSSATNPLFIIAAGPMQVPGEAINRADQTKLPFVTIISHSTWNDNHADNPSSWEHHTGWTWNEIKSTFSSKGLKVIHIVDQNGGSGYDGMNAVISKFSWLKTSSARNNPLYKTGSWDWLIQKQENAKKGSSYDASDAGLIIYLLTGNEKTDPSNAKSIMEGPVAPCITTSVNQAPLVQLTSPVSSDTFTSPASIAISASASDPDGSIRRVEFYNGNNLINVDSLAPYNFVWNNVAAGSYTIKAISFDNHNLASNISSSNVVVKSPVIVPGDGTFTLSAINDASIENGVLTYNDNYLKISPSGKVVYLMFDLSGVTGKISSAKLLLTVVGVAGSGGIAVTKGTHSNWTETSLTNSTKPSKEITLGNISGPYTLNKQKSCFLSIDSIVAGEKLTLILTMSTSGKLTWFASDEFSNISFRPQLIITTQNSATKMSAEEPDLVNVMVSPNPFQDQFYFELQNAKEVYSSILVDNLGAQRVVEVSKENSGRYKVSTKGLSSGWYFLQLTTDNGEKVVRVYKQ